MHQRDKRLLALEGYSQEQGLHPQHRAGTQHPVGTSPPSQPAPHRPAGLMAPLPALSGHQSRGPRALSRPEGAVPILGFCPGPRALSRPEVAVPAAGAGTEARAPPRLLRPRGSAAPGPHPYPPLRTHTLSQHRPGAAVRALCCRGARGVGRKRGGSRAFPAVPEWWGLVFSRTHPVEKSRSGTEGTWEVSASNQVFWCGMISPSTILCHVFMFWSGAA